MGTGALRACTLLAWTTLPIASIGACSMFNREGPTVTCEDLAGGSLNACKDGILASCNNGTMSYTVCHAQSACEQSWQVTGQYRCSATDELPSPDVAGGTVPGGGLTPDGKRCGKGDICVVGTTGGSEVAAFTLSGAEVIFTDDTTVWSAPRDGGFSTALATDDFASNGSIAADGRYAYVVQARARRILRLQGAGVKETAATGSTDSVFLTHLAIDDGRLYWFEDGFTGALRAANTDGSAPIELVASPTFPQSSLQVVGGYLYWDGGGSRLERIPTSSNSTTAPSALDLGAGTGERLSTFAVDDSGIFFALHDASGTAVWRAQKDGNHRTKVAELDDTEQPVAMGTSDQSVYWVDANRGEVRRLSKAGGVPASVNSGSALAARLRVLADDLYVYWAEGARIMRGPK